ncbi:hypothetical protein G5B39_09115 [Rhodobacteraceae bacterium SC52]|nr:hypothetical protein G5B39_09115 [Rhodobacteraceae bacterium SC52]
MTIRRSHWGEFCPRCGATDQTDVQSDRLLQ